MTSAFGIEHGGISKAEEDDKKRKAVAGTAGVAAGVGVGAVAANAKIPEHSHYSKKTRKTLKKLPPGVHEVDTKMLAKKPRKLGSRKQQRAYVASMAQERPTPYSPVPITRYKDGIIQRDNAHSVMANAMKGRKTLIQIEDAPGYRPRRRAGEELVRRGQARYQQRRLKRHMNLPEKKIEALRSSYKESSRKANTAKRPHGVIEPDFKFAKKPYGVKEALKIKPRELKAALKIAKSDNRKRDWAAGGTAAAGTGVLAATPVRRSGAKVDVSGGQMSSKDARKVLSPGSRPGNTKSIRRMPVNSLGPTTVIRYKDGTVIPYDGNHRGTARVGRGDKSIPVKVHQGGERPTVSVARNTYHIARQGVHRKRMDLGHFDPAKKGRHAAEGKIYRKIANASPSRSSGKVALRSVKGPSTAALRTRQGATLATGAALLGTSSALSRKKRND